jgi:hypothetical protein
VQTLVAVSFVDTFHLLSAVSWFVPRILSVDVGFCLILKVFLEYQGSLELCSCVRERHYRAVWMPDVLAWHRLVKEPAA